jgi:DNA polymerase III subunit delta'
MRFSDIPGHAELKNSLIRSVRDNRISHALLLSGPEGNGAMALALAFAQFVMCTSPEENDSCGQCPSCAKFRTMQHPDMHFAFPIINLKDKDDSDDFLPAWRQINQTKPFFDFADWSDAVGAENKQFIIPVREARSILEKLSLTSYMGGYKFMVLWMPELLNVSAANALLKLLEEPPNRTVFLLVTHNYDSVLPTIYSRCQFIRVNALSDDQVADYLIDTGIEPNMAERFAYPADGNLAEAIRLSSGTESDAEHLAEMQQFMRCSYTGKMTEIAGFTEQMSKKGREAQKQFLSYALHFIRQAIVSNYGLEDLARVNNSEAEWLVKFAPSIHHLNAVRIINEINEAYTDISRNVNAKIVFTSICVRVHGHFGIHE